MHRTVGAAVVACLLTALCACAGQGSASHFCSELDANGGAGASFGPIPTFYRKNQLLVAVAEDLKAMGDIVPPAAIAQPWSVRKTALLQVRAAGEQLSNGETLRSSPEPAELTQAEDTLTKYWFAHCRP